MKITDIMIGDWVDVRNSADKDTPHIERITPAHLLRDEPCLGIPITPEILEKIGFVLKPDGWLWCLTEGNEDQDYIFIQFRKGCQEVRICELSFYGVAHAEFRNIFDVHELQHAMRLCGIINEFEL